MQYSDDEDEGKEGYKVGGYHAVKVSKLAADFYVNEDKFVAQSGSIQWASYPLRFIRLNQDVGVSVPGEELIFRPARRSLLSFSLSCSDSQSPAC